jgi:hypothetical protein
LDESDNVEDFHSGNFLATDREDFGGYLSAGRPAEKRLMKG